MAEFSYARWPKHPGRNPAHNPLGRMRWKQKLPDGQELTLRGPRNPSRWLPHQSAAECARRRCQKEAARG